MSLRFSDFVPRNSSAAKGLFNNFSMSARWIYDMIDDQRDAWRRVGNNDLIPNSF